jgi:HD superfamily phosphodiesterase
MKCPGQDSRYWQPGSIFEVKCPKCGAEVEFFKDDTARMCRKCGHKFLNPNMNFGCASYCKYADQCIGTLAPEIMAQREDLLKDRVAIEMKRYFRQDFKRIGHAGRVARYAERLAREEGGEMAVILSAAYLHDIGIRESERKYNSSAARYQEEEGPPVAREILKRLQARDELIEEVCDIIGHHHHPRDEETLNFKVLYDADLITNLEEEKEEGLDLDRLKKIIEKSFLTRAGGELALKVLAKGANHEGVQKNN